jgi:NADH-quinone oxidoreductase subunit J
LNDLFPALAVGCAVALLSALGVVLARKPVYAAVSLLVHSLSLAALFAILSASMVAVAQIIIYSGAIVVLFLFVVTLLPSGGKELLITGGRAVAGLIAGATILAALSSAAMGVTPKAVATSNTDVADIGRALFGPLLLPFELTAPLLLVAVVGAVVIWRRYEPVSRTTPRVDLPRERKVTLNK